MKAIGKSSTPRQALARFILCSMILLALFAHPTPAYACSCVIPGPPSGEFAKADAVFAGQVMSISDKQNLIISLLDRILDWVNATPNYGYRSMAYGYRVTIAVNNSWKGVTELETQVSTGYGGGDCGYPFTAGAQYVIYAHGATNDLSTSSCSRTTEYTQAAVDLSYLKSLPALPLTPAPPISGLPVGTIIVIPVAILMILITFWLLRQRVKAVLGRILK